MIIMEMLPPTLSLVILLGSAPFIFCHSSTTEKLDLSIFDEWFPSTKQPALNSPALRPVAQHETTPFAEYSRSLSPFRRSDTSSYASSLPLPHGLGHLPSYLLVPSNQGLSAPSAPFFSHSYFSSSPDWPAPALVSHSPQQGQRANQFPAANGQPASFYSLLPPVSLSPLPSYQSNSYNPSNPFISNVPQSVLPVQGLQPLDSMEANYLTPPNGYEALNSVASFSSRSNDPYVYSQPVTSSVSYSPPGQVVASFIRTYDLPLVPLVPPSLLPVVDGSSPVNYFLSSPPLVLSHSGISHPQSPVDSTAARSFASFSMQPNAPTVPSFGSPVMSNPYNPFSMTYHGSRATFTNNLPSSFSNYQRNPGFNNHPIYYHK